ncbi:VTT domain-containing protein [Blastococcus montanus]|uniref:TVP38/TMEM64 family protein n=1 Tax=Blastococcus montanus TaxID=3144973 RepID=UPI00320BAE4B
MRAARQDVWLRAAALAALLLGGAVAALVVDLPSPDRLRAWLDAAGAGGWALLVAALTLVLLAPVPRSVLSVLAGAVLGFGPGLAVALAGGVLAGLAAFGLGRVLGRPAAARLAGPRLQRADQFFTGRGFTAVLVGRLIPVIPFAVLSYGSGLSGVRPVPYLAATAVGLVPSTVVQVGIGASAGFVVSRLSTITTVPVVAVVVLLVLAGGLAWWHRRRAGERQRY